MRLPLAGLAAALLAGCNMSAATNNVVGPAGANAAAPANGSAPAAPANTALPAGEGNSAVSGNQSAAGGREGLNRADIVAECISSAPDQLAPGTDLNRLCGCAVDRYLAGGGQNEAMRQCAAEQNVRLPQD